MNSVEDDDEIGQSLNTPLLDFFKQVKLYGRVHGAMAALEFYTLRQWDFVTKNMIELTETMSEQDRETFFFDVRDIKWSSYLEALVLGTRIFLLKDNVETLPIARKNLKK